MLGLDVCKGFADRIDWPGGDSGWLKLVEPFASSLLSNAVAHEVDNFVAIGHPRRVGREPLVRRPLGMAAKLCEACELSIVADCNDQRLIGGGEQLVRHDIRVRVALSRRVSVGD